MIRQRPKTKKVVGITCTIFVLYWIFLKSKKYTHKVDYVIESADPKTAWEFWADFSNWAKMNPTVLQFEIEYEKGNYENWEYGVAYKEYLPKLPFITFWNRGRFKVMPENKKAKFSYQPYRIESEHDACFFFFYCVHTDSDMTFLEVPHGHKSTKIVEKLTYECPPIISTYCESEFKAQRKLIMEKVEEYDLANAF